MEYYDAEWEQIGKTTSRLKIFGGWLVRTTVSTFSDSGGVCVHQIFISDPKHEWVFKYEN